MADQSAVPDYQLAETLQLSEPKQYRALFEDTRLKIVDLLLERAATTSELANALGRPKGTIGHHLKTLEEAGLVHVVRTKMVRAIEAKYYGRTARTFVFHSREHPAAKAVEVAPDNLVFTAAEEIANVPQHLRDAELPGVSTVRYARIPIERAAEWERRLAELTVEFVQEPRGGDVTFGLVVGIYPTDRPRLPDAGNAA
jgi:DNA-binding transcriptional ArsR family regulator